MSLINDALKKAQRQRAQGTPDYTPMTSGDGGGRVAKRGTPMSAQTMVLIGAGAIALVVISAVSAVLFVNSGNKTKPSVASTTASTTSATATSTPAPVAKSEASASAPTAIALPPLPKLAEPTPETVSATAPTATPSSAETKPVARPATPAIRSAAPPEPIASARPETAAPANFPRVETAPAVAADDERVHAFLDALRITGVRSSGNDSRVLMNEKVYRVNDLVDRTLGLRLKVVAADHLTFTDAHGVEYVKNF